MAKKYTEQDIREMIKEARENPKTCNRFLLKILQRINRGAHKRKEEGE